MRLRARPQPSTVIATAAVIGVIVVVTLVATRSPERKPTCRSALIPAYLPPHAIVELVRGSARPRLLVINPASGPGPEATASYRDAVRTAQGAGAAVLGYVPTSYGARPPRTSSPTSTATRPGTGSTGSSSTRPRTTPRSCRYYEAVSRHVRASGKRVVV